MSLKIRRLFEPGKTIGYAIEDPQTGSFYDFQARTFDQNPDNSVRDLVEDWVAKTQANTNLRFLRGAYANIDPADPAAVQLDTPEGVFRAGPYTIYFIDRSDVDRAIEVEHWIAEAVAGTLEFRPCDEPARAAPAPPPATGSGPVFNINIPPDLALRGSLGLDVGALVPRVSPGEPGPAPDPAVNVAPAPAPAPEPAPAPAPEPAPAVPAPTPDLMPPANAARPAPARAPAPQRRPPASPRKR